MAQGRSLCRRVWVPDDRRDPEWCVPHRHPLPTAAKLHASPSPSTFHSCRPPPQLPPTSTAAGTLKTPPRLHLAAGMGLLLHPTSAASLSTLSLGGHFLGDEGVAGIVNACCSCPLSSLDLASCGASQRSVAALAALLRNSRTLRSLNLSGSRVRG